MFWLPRFVGWEIGEQTERAEIPMRLAFVLGVLPPLWKFGTAVGGLGQALVGSGALGG